MKAVVPMLALLLLLLPARPVTPPALDSPGALAPPAVASGAPATSPAAPASPAQSDAPLPEAEPAFCLEGPVMGQLLQGFGCRDLAGRLEKSRLNCATRILREEIVDGRARLDLVIECECEDAQAGDKPIRRLDGEWQVVVDL